ncbi:MAG: hypothetical protein KGK08_04480 [Acidobacteriota bacterium]|nr:hypothetical protein [Acidobacteriota bacterium]
MYLRFWMGKLDGLRLRLWRFAVQHVGSLLFTGVLLLAVTGVVAWHERGKGHLHQLQTQLQLQPKPVESTPAAQPGEKDPVVLQRAVLTGSTTPEFTSVTLLPGRGMQVLQIRASLPDRGEVDLLDAPGLQDAASQLNGKGDDADGSGSLRMGAALEAPWAGVLGSHPTLWQGHPLGDDRSDGGLLLMAKADDLSTSVMPDGGDAQATFNLKNFNGHWVSDTELTTQVLLSARVIDLTISAKNTGTEPEPIGLGWRPRFAVSQGDRASLRLRLPGGEVIEQRGGHPTGEASPLGANWQDRQGSPIAAEGLRMTLTHLQHGFLDTGPMVELRNAAAGYGLRMKLLTSSIQTLKIDAPADGRSITIAPQYNLDEPFGRQWNRGPESGMVVLQPGESTRWKVRLEIFPLESTAPALP